jgi:hypothetical protein
MTRLISPRRGAAAALLAFGALPAACGGPSATPTPAHRSVTPTPTACAIGATKCASSPAATVPPSKTTPAPTPPLAGFAAASVTFVSSQDGWVLGAVDGTLVLARTQDGGITWTRVTPPPTNFNGPGQAGVDGIRFANQQDGWAYGTQLWATHDGGTSWSQVSLPGLNSSAGVISPIQGLETAAGTVDVVYFGTSGFDIASAPVASNSWTVSATTVGFGAGPVPGAQLVIQGSAGWVLENDRTVVAGARLQSGTWASWTPVCSTSEGPAVLAASSTQNLIAACDVGLWGGGSPTENAFVSTNGGGSFSQLATALPSACQGSDVLASSSAAVAAAGCAGDLMGTFDEGGSWSTVYTGGASSSITYVGFTTTTQGVAIEASKSSPLGTLLMTRDGGHTWAPVTI